MMRVTIFNSCDAKRIMTDMPINYMYFDVPVADVLAVLCKSLDVSLAFRLCTHMRLIIPIIAEIAGHIDIDDKIHTYMYVRNISIDKWHYIASGDFAKYIIELDGVMKLKKMATDGKLPRRVFDHVDPEDRKNTFIHNCINTFNVRSYWLWYIRHVYGSIFDNEIFFMCLCKSNAGLVKHMLSGGYSIFSGEHFKKQHLALTFEIYMTIYESHPHTAITIAKKTIRRKSHRIRKISHIQSHDQSRRERFLDTIRSIDDVLVRETSCIVMWHLVRSHRSCSTSQGCNSLNGAFASKGYTSLYFAIIGDSLTGMSTPLGTL